MRLSDFELTRSSESPTKGEIVGNGAYSYFVSGPFGQGYNIRIAGPGGHARLSYNWRDGGLAEVESPLGSYGMTERMIRGGPKGDIVLRLAGDRLETDLTNGLLLSLFVVNHHYANRTGPFMRSPRKPTDRV